MVFHFNLPESSESELMFGHSATYGSWSAVHMGDKIRRLQENAIILSFNLCSEGRQVLELTPCNVMMRQTVAHSLTGCKRILWT